jgi:hypothetical protein
MLRVLISTTVALALASTPLPGQDRSTLRITVVLLDAEQKPAPVPQHALLVSDNPPSASPRRILTKADGTAEVALVPGVYTVESDRPVTFDGKAYQWVATVEVVLGRTARLELTADNAEVSAAAAATAPSAAAPAENDPAFLLTRWQDSVVAVWTTTTRTSGFLVDSRGVVVTSERAIGGMTSAEVQFNPALKLPANVLVSDAEREVAVLRVDSSAVQSLKPVTIECAESAGVRFAADQDLFTIGAPLGKSKDLSSGPVTRAQKQVFADLRLSADRSGGPVFTAAGTMAGLASMELEADSRSDDARIVGTTEVCEVLKAAESKLAAAPAPDSKRLPVEPVQPFPADALEDAAKRRVGASIPYQMASAEFDVSFITPVEVQVAKRRWQQATSRGSGGGAPGIGNVGTERIRLLTEFGHWSRYFEDFPPVLLVRVTPKLVEGFWTKVARGAASTQGVALPPFKRLTSGFLRLRTFCGADEVPPIHPFKLAHRINEREFTHEGLYVFDPAALGPHCASVKLMLYSEKDPEKADTRVADPKVVQQFWEDLAALRR